MKILLVDDHPLFLQGMETYLKSKGAEVADTARSGPEALMKYEMLAPDLVLMDLQMAGCDGIETTRMIKKAYPEANIVILTACEDEAVLLEALQAGASGYLLKGMEPEEFLRQLDVFRRGELPLESGIAGRLLQKLVLQKTEAPEINAVENGLSQRQLGIVQLLSQGLSFKEIADELDLKEVTVKYHINEILAKLHLANKSQLIAYAAKKGII
ncbi:MAG TPA: DNA-binding response regulator [Firmicutes bacterium]|jgi:DNA-binding NarL/FixJ family response regulator|nr:DNA-binding response regulator [Bacillota bacterium]